MRRYITAIMMANAWGGEGEGEGGGGMVKSLKKVKCERQSYRYLL